MAVRDACETACVKMMVMMGRKIFHRAKVKRQPHPPFGALESVERWFSKDVYCLEVVEEGKQEGRPRLSSMKVASGSKFCSKYGNHLLG